MIGHGLMGHRIMAPNGAYNKCHGHECTKQFESTNRDCEINLVWMCTASHKCLLAIKP